MTKESLQRVDVSIEKQKNEWIQRRVRPGEKSEQLVDFGRLLKLWVDQREAVERVPAENEERSDQHQRARSTERTLYDVTNTVGVRRHVPARYGDGRANKRR